MSKFYSRLTGGFYAEEIHGSRTVERFTRDEDTGEIQAQWTEPNPDCLMPPGVVEISDAEHAGLLEGQSQGKRIEADANGYPVLITPPAPTLADLQVATWEEIKAERDRRIQHGGYKVGEKWFHSDTFSRTQQMGLVMLGANIPANLQWKTMDGSFVPMTQALAGQIFAAAAASDIAIFGAAETRRAAMEASADASAYDVTVGWPLAFWE